MIENFDVQKSTERTNFHFFLYGLIVAAKYSLIYYVILSGCLLYSALLLSYYFAIEKTTCTCFYPFFYVGIKHFLLSSLLVGASLAWILYYNLSWRAPVIRYLNTNTLN